MTTPLRVLFFGTPFFAVPAFRALHDAGYELVCVTNPDRPTGRKQILTPSPVKQAAIELSVSVLQPNKLDEAFFRSLPWKPDIGIVVAYGKILKPDVLALPKYGVLNIHASLLPLHRGANPIRSSILAGDTETGVSIMVLDEGMDTGPVLAQSHHALAETETWEELTNILAHDGARLLLATLPGYLAGTVQPQPQDHTKATATKKVATDDARLDWSKTALELSRIVRANAPDPGAWTMQDDLRLKVLNARIVPEQKNEPSGTIVSSEGQLGVVCGDKNILVLTSVQPAGKKVLDGTVFANGYRTLLGKRLS